VFQILLSLSDGPMHGYAIIQDVTRRTDGEIQLTPSTLYDALARLVDQRWIEETASDGPRRRTYTLTLRGRDAMTREAHRLARLIAAARAKKVFQGR
jgi:DNA-binding PadR family transcriptional regulator